MADSPDGPAQNAAAQSRRLDSWKEIASFLGRGIRTVQRWERDEGLPVHRLPHAQRGSVFADSKELTAWWDSRQIAPEPPAAASPRTDTEVRLERVTSTTAATFWPALSSDARMLVYVSDVAQDGGAPQVWLQQIGGAAAQLTSGMRDCEEPAFFSDDTRIVFSAAGDSTRNVYEMPTLGGSPRMLKRAARCLRFSPDAQWLAYIALEARDTLRVASAAGGDERTLAPSLLDIASATWSDDGRHLLVVGHPNASVDLDCWVVPVDGGTPLDTGALRRGRQQGLIVITMPPAWNRGSIFYSAAGRQGLHVWRQRVSPVTFEAIGAPELMTPGGDFAFFPSVARHRLSYVGTHADSNLWSVAIDAVSGKAHGPLRRLTRGAGIVSHLTLSRDGRTLAYFAARTSGGELRIRDLESGSDTAIAADAGSNRGFPVISPAGERIACGALVPGPPLQRPVLVTTVADGETRLVRADGGGRPRQWLDERTLVLETFGAGLNAFVRLDIEEGTQRPLLSSSTRRLSNPRVSPDGCWLAFDAATTGGLPAVSVVRVDDGAVRDEAGWVFVAPSASHPFWSRDGHLLYYLPTAPSVDIRNRVEARRFDASSGRVEGEAFSVLQLSEMIVPAMVTAVAPIAAPDQIIFVLGNFRGDVWIRDV